MSTYDNSRFSNRPVSYTVVFQVDLTSPSYLSYPNPNGNQTEATMAATRSTWAPSGFALGDQSRDFNHGDQFTAYDDEAYYLKANFLKSATNPNGVLTIVTETP
jgi:hypothetical protein